MMKKNLLNLLLVSVIFNVKSQDSFPSYPKIIKTYFKHYATDSDYERLLNFAKKKDGWYYQRVNPLKSNQLVEEEKFWTAETGYNPNLSADRREYNDSIKKNKDVTEYLSQTNMNPWYGYERCHYFGYTGWEYDIIKDYGKVEVLKDTLLEGLAKAYSSLAISYLWYQQGGEELKKDTLQRKLERLELPSSERLDKVQYYLDKSIETYERLKQQSPAYVCMVGNVSLKKFNESMHGYMQMIMSLREDKASAFMNTASLEKEYIAQAKNYLNSCDSNAVLFTYGDNDTYQLWYVQQKENYRKDISVINTSLLGLPVYIDMLRKNKTVSFACPPSFYGKKESDVAYYKKESPRPIKKELQKFLQDIYSFKKSISYNNTDGKEQLLNAFNVKDITIHISPKAFNKHSTFKTTDTIIRITLKEHLLINDMLLLDIAASNINERPVYFTSSSPGIFDSSLLQQGIVFKLFPRNKKNLQLQQEEIKKLEFFADKIHNPVIQFKQNDATHYCIDGNNSFFQLYSKIATYYKEKNNHRTAKLWLDKCFSIFPSVSKNNFPGAYFLIAALQETNKQKLKELCEIYADYCYDKCRKPSAINGYMPEEECLLNLDSLLQILQDEEIKADYIDNLINQFANKGK